MKKIHTYEIQGKNIDSVMFKDAVRAATSIDAKLSSGHASISMSFLYDAEEELLHTSSFTGLDFPLFGNPITPDHLVCFLGETTMKVYIKCDKEYPRCPGETGDSGILPATIGGLGTIIETTMIKDYPQMITDLNKKDLVVVRDSGSLWSQDPRLFKFVSGIEEGEWAVDCLGTMLCQDITLTVENEWESIYSKGI